MADQQQLDMLLKEGVLKWNEWRRKSPGEQVDLSEANLKEIDLSGADLMGANMQGAFLRRAKLQGAFLNKVHLEGADLDEAYMKEVILIGAHLEGADLHKVCLEGALLYETHLEGTDLYAANLKRAKLRKANLEGTDLQEANLEGADLRGATLGGKLVPQADFQRIQNYDGDFPELLPPSNLRGVFFDSATELKGITLGSREHGFVLLADIRWGSVNLAVINWAPVTILGDEREAHQCRNRGNSLREQLDTFQQAIRANHQLVAILQDQAMLKEADYFAYRAQVLHRKVLLLQLLLQFTRLWEKLQATWVWRLLVKMGRWLQKTWVWKLVVEIGQRIKRLWRWVQRTQLWQLVMSIGRGIRELWPRLQGTGLWQLVMSIGREIRELWHWLLELGVLLPRLVSLVFALFIGLLAGYGYKPERSLFWYLLVVGGFAVVYHVFCHVPNPEAFFLSLTSFHGRGFFPAPTNGSLINSPVEFLAAVEAVAGLFIEISFVAAFTRRFFGR